MKLPNDSLTKEIALTQDLQQLFIDYQIPSDLLSYDGDASASVSTKACLLSTPFFLLMHSQNISYAQIDTVRRYVKNMQDMIQRSKNAQLQEVSINFPLPLDVPCLTFYFALGPTATSLSRC